MVGMKKTSSITFLPGLLLLLPVIVLLWTTTTISTIDGFTTTTTSTTTCFLSNHHSSTAKTTTATAIFRTNRPSLRLLRQQHQLQPQPHRLLHYATIPKETEVITRVFNDTIRCSSSSSSSSLGENDVAMGWDCNDEVECVEVPLCNENVCRTSLDVRYHNVWYDVSGWRKKHPAGSHWIDYYDGRDATEVLDGFHTMKGRNMISKLPKSKSMTVQLLSSTTPSDTNTQLNFRTLRTELENTGYWERNMVHEYTQLSLWATCVMSAALMTHVIPTMTLLSTNIALPIASMLLAISMTAAGWLGHDYIHGIDTFAMRYRNFAAIAAGLAPTWWSDKHNKHHALTNEMGVDEDIATDPFLYAWAPDPSQDSPLRKIQHYIFWIPFSFMFALWRIDSVTVAIQAVEKKRPDAKKELYCLLIHYAILFTVFPITVWLPAIFVSGLMSALIVTPTHQSESMFDDYQPDWVTAQFQSTRNAITTNPFSEWLWGGMQYQLEHHLFPSMPRNKYPQLRTILQQFAKDNKIPGGYRETDEFDIIKMNWLLYKKVAESAPVPGAPSTRGRPGQIGAIRDTESPAMALEIGK